LAASPDAHTLAVIGDQITLWNIADPTRPVQAAEAYRHPIASISTNDREM
jgi:hypothetical protein